MLWPIRWTGSSGKAPLDLLAASARARRFTPAIGGTRVTSTRLPAGAQEFGDAPEVGGQRQPAQADPVEAEEAMRQHDRRVESGASQGCRSRYNPSHVNVAGPLKSSATRLVSDSCQKT